MHIRKFSTPLLILALLIGAMVFSWLLRDNISPLSSSVVVRDTDNVDRDTDNLDLDTDRDASSTLPHKPDCGPGYDLNVCHTGRPTKLCHVGDASRLNRVTTQAGNMWQWTCSYAQQSLGCSVKDESRCIVISVEGYNPDGTFHATVDTVVKKYQCSQYKPILREKIESKTSSGQELIQKINTKISLYNSNDDAFEKILVAAHSLGAVAAYSVKLSSGPGTDASYLFFDPPYNYPCVGWSRLCPRFLLNFLSPDTAINVQNGQLIVDMKKKGLTSGHPELIDWSGGLDGKQNQGTTKSDDQLHMNFLNNPGALNRIDAWVVANCSDLHKQ